MAQSWLWPATRSRGRLSFTFDTHYGHIELKSPKLSRLWVDDEQRQPRPPSIAQRRGRVQMDFGPVLKTFAALEPAGREALERELEALVARFNRAQDGGMTVPSAYLAVVVTKR